MKGDLRNVRPKPAPPGAPQSEGMIFWVFVIGALLAGLILIFGLVLMM